MDLDTAVNLWSEVEARLAKLDSEARWLERFSLLNDILRAGNSYVVFEIFVSAWLSQVRA